MTGSFRFRPIAWGLVSLAALLPAAAAPGDPRRALSLDDRVAAQEAIERVYYRHQLSATLPFEEAVPRGVLEGKVRTYLKQSAALAELWSTPVTAEMLQAEWERIARSSRFPDRLREIHEALGNDPVLIQECFARPVVVDRLARNFFALDATLHAASRSEAEELHARLLEGSLDPATPHPRRTIVELRREGEGIGSEPHGPPGVASGGLDVARRDLDPSAFDRARRRAPRQVGEVGPVREEREAFAVRLVLAETVESVTIATYSVPKRTWEDWWGEAQGRLDESSIWSEPASRDGISLLATRQESLWSLGRPSDAAADGVAGTEVTTVAAPSSATSLPEDIWDNASLDDVPSGREGHTAVWTGSLMVVWGGSDGGRQPFSNTGGRYDPLTDTWSPTSTAGAPYGRTLHSAVWTGSLMVVWGGWAPGIFSPYNDTGGRYDPVSDTWSATSTAGAPVGRGRQTAIWTGRLMVVWGGHDYFNSFDTGGRYDPTTDIWTPTAVAGAPTGRRGHTAVWTGSRMVVWGGEDPFSNNECDTGGSYDPSTDTWTPTSTSGAPAARFYHTAVWTGSVMVVCCGIDGGYTGGRYDPVSDTWTPISTIGAPARYNHTAVWTGNHLIIWGGGNFRDDGARYDPVADSWTATAVAGAPMGRRGHTAVWTGSRMVVWGGEAREEGWANTGGRYDPASDAWTPTSTAGTPEGRQAHTAVWTGSLMIVWGGYDASAYLRTGDRYDPLTDAWTPTSRSGAPFPRGSHTAVWTGDEMVVWGGEVGPRLRTGGRYDPVADAWNPTSEVGAPAERSGHTAVWMGTEMVVWGGRGETFLMTGGRYNPRTDTWTSTSTAGAPLERAAHTAVWTGNWMVVWGGYHSGAGGTFLANGGRYDPATDRWTPTSTVGAPLGRTAHTAVWTGNWMVVWGGYNPGAGGTFLANGGRYDPATDTWTPTSTAGAPTARVWHSAVWTGSLMVVWGGHDPSYHPLDTGARYHPIGDVWAPISTDGAPYARSYHTAVWTGSLMIVWGGDREYGGGRYLPGEPADLDGDGLPGTFGDCDDTNPLVFPTAPERCDDLDNDCDGIRDDFPTSCGPSVCPSTGFCSAGVDSCAPDPAVACNDGNPCSLDACDPTVGCYSTAVDPACLEPKGQGFYKRLCRSDHPEETLTPANVACVSDSSTFAWVDSVAAMCEALDRGSPSDKCEHAEGQFMATLLNRCKGRITDSEPLDSSCSDVTTVGASIADADALLSSPTRTTADCERALCEAAEINSREALAPVLTLDLDSGGGVRLEWTEPPIYAGQSPAPRYQVWRRAHGSGAFTEIATVDVVAYVDEAPDAASYDYQITVAP